MKHKILISALSAIMVASCAVGLAACNGNSETHTHEAVHHEAVAPTCGVDGTIEYWSCEGCNELFSDEGCTNVITSVVDPATGEHTYGEAYGRDDNGHWQICTVCGAKGTNTEHVYGETYGRDKNGHWQVCTVCGKASSTTEHEHIYYDADTNSHKSFCSVCGEMSEGEHTFGTEYESDKTGHWHVCTACEAASEIVEHTWEDNECTVCDYAVVGSKGLTYEFTDETHTAYRVVKPEGGNTTSGWSSATLVDGYIVIPSTYNGLPVVEIGDHVFYNVGNGRDDILGVIVSAGIQSIGSQSFGGIGSESITIEFEEGSQLKVVGESAFASTKIMSITLPYGVEEIGAEAFRSCTNLSGEFIIPDSVTTIGNGAFDTCSSITKVIIPDSVTKVGAGLFRMCKSLESVKLPSSITSLETDDRNGFFQSCTSLTTVVIPEGVTSIGAYCFRSCEKLTSLSLPSTLETISDRAFQASGITSITIPEKVESIANYTFFNCSDLKEVVISTNIKSIGDSALRGCTDLKVYYYGSSEQYALITLGTTVCDEGTMTIYYYSESQPAGVGNYWHMVEGVPAIWTTISE